MSNELTFKNDLLEALESKNANKLKEIFEVVPTIDIAEALETVDNVRSLIYIFRVVSKDYTGDLFSYMSSEQQERIIKSFSDKDLIELLENSFTDDIVDTMEEMPANVVNRILRVAPSNLRKDINTLLNYKEYTAGSLMTTEYIEMHENITVKEAISMIREKGREVETIYTLFIRDAKRTLVGTVHLDDLVFAKENDIMEDIMNRDFVTCNVNDDQEEVANMFKRYDLNAMAVVNNENKIIGIITIDDIVDIIVQEAYEDVSKLKQVGTMEEPYLKTSVWKLVKKCLPWIFALMILQIGTAAITSAFDGLIASFAVLAVFSPLILDAGGNSGGQTTTMIVRSIALDEFKKGDLKRVLWKELRVSAIIAIFVGLFAVVLTFTEMAAGVVNIQDTYGHDIWLTRLYISLLVGVTLIVTMIISRLIGCLLPFFAKMIKVDPAVMCSPFTTTIVDIVSLLTYFIIWKEVFAPLIIPGGIF
ncbi:MAG: magnesium transporter [Bacilli bacterium]|jgi:magnesium transporter|nr:magnesium transporter [Bacilli bacterium]